MNAKKILYLCDLNLTNGGAQRITFKTLGCLSKMFNIIVYMPEKPSHESLSLLSSLRIEYILDTELNIERLKSTIISKKIDLILIQWENFHWIFLAYQIKKSMGIEYVVFVHELPVIGTPTGKIKSWYFEVYLKLLRIFYNRILDMRYKEAGKNSTNQVARALKIKKNVSLNLMLKTMAEILFTIKGLKSAKKIIAMGPASKFYIDNYLKLGNIIELKHVAAPDIIVNTDLYNKSYIYDICFMAARLEPEKGIFDMLVIVHYIKKIVNYNIKAVVLGRFINDRTEKIFLSKIKELDLESNIFLLGFVSEEEKINILCSSKVFLYPSTKDVFSISLADALACGLPVVVFDLPFVRQFDQVGINKVKYRDINAMSTKVIELLNLFIKERAKYNNLRETISKNLISSFSWDITCNEQVQAISVAFDDIHH
ncbi:MAG: glycosyltransferase family 4 protein [Caldisphaera sp.]